MLTGIDPRTRRSLHWGATRFDGNGIACRVGELQWLLVGRERPRGTIRGRSDGYDWPMVELDHGDRSLGFPRNRHLVGFARRIREVSESAVTLSSS